MAIPKEIESIRSKDAGESFMFTQYQRHTAGEVKTSANAVMLVRGQ
jgi:hypothetical protein